MKELLKKILNKFNIFAKAKRTPVLPKPPYIDYSKPPKDYYSIMSEMEQDVYKYKTLPYNYKTYKTKLPNGWQSSGISPLVSSIKDPDIDSDGVFKQDKKIKELESKEYDDFEELAEQFNKGFSND